MYKAIAIMAGLVLVSWAPYVFHKSVPQVFPPFLISWGGDATGCAAQIDTSSFVEAANKYHVFDICHIIDGSVDELADTRIAVSKPFTVTGGVVTILFKFPPNSAIVQAIKDAAASGVQTAQLGHSVVILPKEEDGSNIKTLGDVSKSGGFILMPGRQKPQFLK